MKKIVRILVLNGCLVIAFFVGRSKWIEFRDNEAGDRYSQPSYRKATDNFRKVLGVVPFAAGHHALADSYLDEGLEDRAVEEYKKTLEADKRSVRAYLALSDIYLRRGSYKEALDLLRKAEVSIPNDPDIKELRRRASFTIFLVGGVKALKKGDLSRAREFLSSALKINPNSAQVHYLLAFSFNEKQDFLRVEDLLKEAISLSPNFYLARGFLGDVYFRRGDFEAAIEQYQFFLAVRGDDPSVLNDMGLAYMNLERYELARQSLERAVALEPSNVTTRYNLAAVCRDQGMLDRAAAGFKDVIQAEPDYPNVHNDLGDVYKKTGREQEALREYRISLEHGNKRLSQGSRDPQLLVELAHAYNGISENSRAEKLVQEALAKDPLDQKAYLTLANIYRGADRLEAAVAVLEKAKKLTPGKNLFLEENISDIKKQMALSRR